MLCLTDCASAGRLNAHDKKNRNSAAKGHNERPTRLRAGMVEEVAKFSTGAPARSGSDQAGSVIDASGFLAEALTTLRRYHIRAIARKLKRNDQRPFITKPKAKAFI